MPVASIVVTGRVQGVGFRAFVARTADDLQVDGEVWNRSDGAVELLASHEQRAILQDLCERLWRGPGHVSDVKCVEIPHQYASIGFRIAASR